MAMIVVAACFAQNGNKYEVVGVPADQNMDRSNWYGWYAQSGYVHTQVAESEYFLFLPAGTFSTQVSLEKVRFYTIPSETSTTTPVRNSPLTTTSSSVFTPVLPSTVWISTREPLPTHNLTILQ